jgi:hypothetical protein
MTLLRASSKSLDRCRFEGGRGACHFRARTGGDARGIEVRQGAYFPTSSKAGIPRSDL